MLVLTFVLGDLLLAQLYWWINGHNWPAGDVERTYRIQHSVFHHGLAPNRSIDDARWGARRYKLRTNSLGFKDSIVRAVPLRTDRHRILFIGDSFTEGIGVEYEQTFVGRIAASLDKQEIDVLNAAASSYSPIIYQRKVSHLIEEVGLKVDEVVVYIDISDIADEVDRYALSGSRIVAATLKERVAEWIKQNTVITFSILNAVRSWSASASQGASDQQPDGAAPAGASMPPALDAQKPAFNHPTAERRCAWTYNKAALADYGDRGLAKARESMTKLAALLAQRKIALTIAVYPWPDQVVSDPSPDSLQVQVWRKWCAEHGARFINHFPQFAADTPPEKKEILDRYFIPGDAHWTEAGHELIARQFLAEYQARLRE